MVTLKDTVDERTPIENKTQWSIADITQAFSIGNTTAIELVKDNEIPYENVVTGGRYKKLYQISYEDLSALREARRRGKYKERYVWAEELDAFIRRNNYAHIS